MIRPLTSLAIALTLMPLSGCGSDGPPRDPAPTPSASIANLDQFAPADYWDIWKGDLTLPDQFPPNVTKDEWLGLVHEAESKGVRSMDEERQHTLLTGAAKAYLMSVRSTQRRIEDPASGARADVTEAYSADVDGLYMVLAAREQNSHDGVSEWSDILLSTAGTSALTRTFPGSIDESLETWTWSNKVDTWTCSLDQPRRGRGQPSFSGTVFYYLNVAYMLYGAPVGEDIYEGRPVVVVRSHDGHEVWVDSATLFPMFYVNRSPGSSRVSLLGINLNPVIDKPAGECRT